MSVELMISDVKKDKSEIHTVYGLYLKDGENRTLVESSVNEKRILRLAEEFLREGKEVQMSEFEIVAKQTRTYYDVKLDE